MGSKSINENLNYQNKVLIVDDDKTLCQLLNEELKSEGFNSEYVFNGKEALEKLNHTNYDLILLDLEMPNINGDQVLDSLKEYNHSTQVIVLTAKYDVKTAIRTIKAGAFDFLTKPYEIEELLSSIERALNHKNLVLQNKLLTEKLRNLKPGKIIGSSEIINKTLLLSLKAAKSGSNVLLFGETGTGKELFSEYIHENSDRSKFPLVAINCASLPENLIESELFGYEKGAFTDAKTGKPGLVEVANGGTLFLDEIGELPLSLQPKLLRFLENGEFRRIGGVANRTSNVRIIAATNRNLEDEVKSGTFRADLLFRINVISIVIPPLRERGEDIIELAQYFLNKKTVNRNSKSFSEDALKALLKYDFPGNVRELQHIVERAIIFSDDMNISIKDLNLQIKNNNNHDILTPTMTLEQIEKIHLENVLKFNNFNREETARTLGISQKTLYTKIKKYSLIDN